MSTATIPTDALDDARTIALATVADAGSLLDGSEFEPNFAVLAIEGAIALFCLGGHDHPAVTGSQVGSLSQLGIKGRRALHACAEHHLVENRDYLAYLIEESGNENDPVDLAKYGDEVARAQRVIAVLDPADD